MATLTDAEIRALAPGNLGDFVNFVGMTQELQEVLYRTVGATPEANYRDFAAIPELEFITAMDAMRIQGQPLTMMQRGTMTRLREAVNEVRYHGSHLRQELGVAAGRNEMVLYSPTQELLAGRRSPLPSSEASSEVFFSRLRPARAHGWDDQMLADWAQYWSDSIRRQWSHAGIQRGEDPWNWLIRQLGKACEPGRFAARKVWEFKDDRFIKKKPSATAMAPNPRWNSSPR